MWLPLRSHELIKKKSRAVHQRIMFMLKALCWRQILHLVTCIISTNYEISQSPGSVFTE